jgi:O-antigen/teichoic acid export membrane protein
VNTRARHRLGGSGRIGTTHRLGWGLADQAVSSLSNFLAVIFVARALGPSGFGIFSLAYLTYGFSLNVSRGLATDPLVVRYSGVSTDSWRRAVRNAAGTATIVGCVIGAGCAAVCLVLGGSLGAAFLVLGGLLPGLLLQDSWRYAFFASGQGRKSFTNDLAWGLALVPLIALATHEGGVPWFVLAWGGAGCFAALLGIFQARIVPRPTGTRMWLTQQRELGSRYLVENLSISTATQLRFVSVGATAGLSAVGTVRAAEVLLGPWIAVLQGLSMVAVPEAARALRRSLRALVVFCTALAIVQAVGVVLWGLTIMFLVPDAFGTRLLGSLWEPATALILPTTLAFMGIGFWNGAAAGLRGLAAAPRSLRATLICACLYLVGGAGGAVAGGALGSAWGVAAATMTGAAVWWLQFRAGLRDCRQAHAVADLPEAGQTIPTASSPPVPSRP